MGRLKSNIFLRNVEGQIIDNLYNSQTHYKSNEDIKIKKYEFKEEKFVIGLNHLSMILFILAIASLTFFAISALL